MTKPTRERGSGLLDQVTNKGVRRILEEQILPSIESLIGTAFEDGFRKKWEAGKRDECVTAIIDGAKEKTRIWAEEELSETDFYDLEKQIILNKFEEIFS